MHRHRKSHIALAIGAAALAGYVDAIGFLSLGGFFVSFMSGNTTRFAVGTAGIPEEAWIAGRLIAFFVLGVIAGSLIGRMFTWLRQPMILVLVALLIALAAAAGAVGAAGLATLLVAGAMGMENTTFERDGEVSIGLTYMTGTLVKLGQRIARALTGGPLLDWTPYALLWLGLAGGAISGAIIWPVVGLGGLWFGSGAALLLALGAFFMARHERAEKAVT
jgi:uncharacterized membrane protein YoaK (UPF0700 family)